MQILEVPGLDDEAIACILLQKAVKAKYWVSYGSENGRSFCIHIDNGVIEFKEHPNNLHYATFDENKGVIKKKKKRCFNNIEYENDGDVVMMLDTIHRQYEGCTKQEIKRAIFARCLQAIMMSPSQSDFMGMIHVNMLHDTNLKLSDCQCSHDIFWKKMIYVRGG